MQYNYSIQHDILVFSCAFILIFLIAILVVVSFILNTVMPFIKEKDYIKMEMGRSFEEDEYIYWKSELKKLYLSHIPIIGRFFR